MLERTNEKSLKAMQYVKKQGIEYSLGEMILIIIWLKVLSKMRIYKICVLHHVYQQIYSFGYLMIVYIL
jgi:hypothetical protein